VLSSSPDLALTVLADVVQNASFPDAEVTLAKRNPSDSLPAVVVVASTSTHRYLFSQFFLNATVEVGSDSAATSSKIAVVLARADLIAKTLFAN
jgi:hypothetical protein